MTATGQVLSVKRAEDDETPCRRCDRPIRRGQRVVLVLGVGNLHLRCVANRPRHSQDVPASGGAAQEGTT